MTYPKSYLTLSARSLDRAGNTPNAAPLSRDAVVRLLDTRSRRLALLQRRRNAAIRRQLIASRGSSW